MAMRLVVEIISAYGLPAADGNGKSDPYVKFYWRGQKYKTEVQRKTLNPKWDAKFVLDYDRKKDKLLRLEIWDWDMLATNDPLGKVLLDLDKLDLSGVSDGKYSVQALKGNGSGLLHVKITPLGGPGRSQQRQPQPQPQYFPVYQPVPVYYPTPVPYPTPYPGPPYGYSPPPPYMPCHPEERCTCPQPQYPPFV